MVQPEIRGHDGDLVAAFMPPVWSMPTHYDPRPGIARPSVVVESYALPALGGPHVDPLDTAAHVCAVVPVSPAVLGVAGYA